MFKKPYKQPEIYVTKKGETIKIYRVSEDEKLFDILASGVRQTVDYNRLMQLLGRDFQQTQFAEDKT